MGLGSYTMSSTKGEVKKKKKKKMEIFSNLMISKYLAPEVKSYQLAWPQLETQLGQNSAWAKATTAFIFMSVCVSVWCVSH